MSENLVMNYIKDIADHLWNSGLYGKASIVVGAGFSKNAVSHSCSTMPDWNELSEFMYKNICPPPENENSEDFRKWHDVMRCKTSGKNVLKVAEEYAVTYGHNNLDRLIEHAIDDLNYHPSELHRELLELPWNDVFTTNYDTLLERSISMIDRNSNRNYKIIRQCKELPGSIQPRIIKLHGCVNVSGPYIITEEDYRTYPMTYAPFVNTVQQAMLETQLCMIGFSGDDPNFLNWLGWLRDNMGEYCPKLYLCGIFNTMTESERKLLENKGILLVDLSVLVEKNSQNIFFEAYKAFFSKLKSYKNKPQIKKLNNLYDPKKEKIDIDSLRSALKKDHKILTENLFFPIEINQIINNRVDNYIDIFLNQDNITQNIMYEILYYLLYRSYKGLSHINDTQSEKLETIIKNLDFSKYNQLGVIICFYLCLTYRIDGKINKYESIIKVFEDQKEYLDNEEKYELIIEKSRFALCCLNYTEGIELLDNIPDDVNNMTILLKKIGMLHQFGQKQKAKNLLQKVSSMFAQEKYSENLTAAYSGYINLLGCYISYDNNIKQLSDDSIYLNSYNIRYILNEYKSKIFDEYYNENGKKEKEKAFNPNSYTYHYTIIVPKSNHAIELAFEYIYFIDQLCIPIFNDHYSSIYQSIQMLSAISQYPFWRISEIARFNHKDEYNKIFSRSFMLNLKDYKSDLHIIFDNIKNIIDLYLKEKNKYLNTYIIGFENVLDLFSRFAIHEKTDTYWEYIKKILELWHTTDMEFDRYGVSNVIERIKYYIMPDELIKHLPEFFSNLEDLRTFYLNAVIPNRKSVNEIVNQYIDVIIGEISSNDESIRNKGLVKLFSVSKLSCIQENYKEIEAAIWSQKDENGLPKNNNFFPYAWEKFSKGKSKIFSDAIKKYFLNINWQTNYTDNGICDGGKGYRDIANYYISLFYLSSLSDKYKYNIEFDQKETIKIISACIQHVKTDMKILDFKYSIFDTRKTVEEKFIYIGMICSILVMQYKINNNNIDKNILSEINKLNDLLVNCKIRVYSLELMSTCLDKDRIDLNLLDKIEVQHSNKWESFYLGLNELICISEKFNYKDTAAENKLLPIINSMPYMNSDILINMPYYLLILISRKTFYNDNIDNIIVILTKTFNNAHDIMSDELVWDFYYNLAMFIKEYKEEYNTNKSEKLHELEDKLIELQVPEINKLFLIDES